MNSALPAKKEIYAIVLKNYHNRDNKREAGGCHKFVASDSDFVFIRDNKAT
jgi:hypothetical protein